MYDVAVVGAGPAGSMTAYCLGRRGYDVLLLDRESFPRHKPCGGGLPVHAVNLLREKGIDPDPYVRDVTKQVKFLYKSEDPVETDLSDAPVTMVDRGEFDTALAEFAEDQGVTFLDGVGFETLTKGAESCELDLSDRRLEARFVVGADGAQSRVGRSVNLMEGQDCGVALDAEVDVEPEIYRREEKFSTFNVNYVNRGYGWIFPKGDYLSMGVGGYGSNLSYPEAMDRFLEETVGEENVLDRDVYGHPLPFFQGVTDVVEGRVALVGDAAGMVDALSGEGIFYALKGGTILAESLDRAFEENLHTLQHYRDRLEETVFKELRWSAKLANVFFKFPRKCYEQGVKRPQVVDWIKRVVVSEFSYDEIYEKIWNEIKSRVSSRALATIGLG